LGVRGREERGHRRGLPRREERRALGADRVEDGPHVVHARLERGTSLTRSESPVPLRSKEMTLAYRAKRSSISLNSVHSRSTSRWLTPPRTNARSIGLSP